MSSQILRLFSTTDKFHIPAQELHKITQSIFRAEKIPSSRKVNLVCCTDYRIKKLNTDYRGKNSVTDVLSFPFADEDFLGEIYISFRRVEVQARRYGHSGREEFIRLFIHGLLHLAGYDHIDTEERTVMEQREQKFLKKVSPPSP